MFFFLLIIFGRFFFHLKLQEIDNNVKCSSCFWCPILFGFPVNLEEFSDRIVVFFGCCFFIFLFCFNFLLSKIIFLRKMINNGSNGRVEIFFSYRLVIGLNHGLPGLVIGFHGWSQKESVKPTGQNTKKDEDTTQLCSSFTQ